MRLSHLLTLIIPFTITASASLQEQLILAPKTPMLQSQDPIKFQESESKSESSPFTSSQPTLADLLTIDSSISIYYSYARETDLASTFASGSVWFTMLVPTNKAVMALARKPHQGPESMEPQSRMSEQEFDERSKRNVEQWVSAHIIPSHISLSDAPALYETLQDGKLVTFTPVPDSKPESPDWMRVTLEDGVRLIGMKKAQNGVIYLVDGTVVPT